MAYRNTFGSYAVKAGIEAADRYELFKRLSSMMPDGIEEAPAINRLEIKNKSKKQVTAKTRALPFPTSPALATYNIQIACNQKDLFVSALQEILSSKRVKGKINQINDQCWEFTNQFEQCHRINISFDPLPEEHLASLDLQNRYSKSAAAAANLSRSSRIESNLMASPLIENTKHGILVELLDYRKIKSKQRLKDPKPGIRWGYAYAKRILQFFVSEEMSESGLHKKCLNTTLDLLRQLNFPLGIPFYTGNNNIKIPTQLDILGIYIVRLNARNAKEDNSMVIIYVPK
jgi:hypothetical protein